MDTFDHVYIRVEEYNYFTLRDVILGRLGKKLTPQEQERLELLEKQLMRQSRNQNASALSASKQQKTTTKTGKKNEIVNMEVDAMSEGEWEDEDGEVYDDDDVDGGGENN